MRVERLVHGASGKPRPTKETECGSVLAGVGTGRKVGARADEDIGPYGGAIGWFGIVGAGVLTRPLYRLKFSSPSRQRIDNAIFAVLLLSAAAAQEGRRVAWN